MARPGEIVAFGNWATNGELIADVATLGWIRCDDTVLDVTYGLGGFWTKVAPHKLVGLDANPAKCLPRRKVGVDFRSTGMTKRGWDVVVFDPPYKLNGTPSLEMDERYGIEIPTRWQDRMQLIADGMRECCRVSRRVIITKSQDQVVSGSMRWQSDMLTEIARDAGFRKAERLDFHSTGPPQPEGRRQLHARHEYSQLHVFARAKEWDRGWT